MISSRAPPRYGPDDFTWPAIGALLDQGSQRYGWTGGTGTTAHVIPATGTVAILLTQVAMPGPTPVPLQKAFWTYAAHR